jgi:hypothetical protein
LNAGPDHSYYVAARRAAKGAGGPLAEVQLAIPTLILATVLALNLSGDWLRDVLDPTLQTVD